MPSKKMQKIYVAGPYSSNNILGILNNIQQGIRQCAKILKDGKYAVYCPWLDYQYHFFEPGISIKQYQKNSMAWLESVDMLVVLPGYKNSKGTQKEIRKAKKLKIPIFYDFKKMKEAIRCGK